MHQKTLECQQPPYVLVAPNGARRGAKDHPAIPVTVPELVETAKACSDAGANGLHLHVRDKAGRHSLDSGLYLETIAELRRKVPEIDVQITTEAAGLFDVAQQLFCLRSVKPEWASISVREIARDEALAPQVYAECAAQGTRVQHILYDQSDAALLDHWQDRGIVQPDQQERLLVLGRYSSGRNSDPGDLDVFLPQPSRWMLCAFGKHEHACLSYAAENGGDVRVGFENSMVNSKGRLWADNAASVAALVELLKGSRR